MQEDRIYGLIAQAEDIQAHAVKLQASAEDALKRLPEAARSSIEGVAGEILVEAAQEASRGLVEASRGAAAASAAMKRTGFTLVFYLLLAALVIGCSSLAVFNLLIHSLVTERNELRQQVSDERSTLEELQSKSWNLELITYSDGRGIALPKGVKVEGIASLEDGRVIILLTK